VLLCVIADEDKQKPKRKRAKQLNILKPSVKKIKGQAADNKGNYTSEATNNVSEVENNNFPQDNSSNKSDETNYSGSLYTQELSSKENENEKPSTDAKSKPMRFETMTETSQNDTLRQEEASSSLTKPENVSLPECKQPFTNIGSQETTNEMQMLPADGQMLPVDGNETQFTVTSKTDEDIINCSQDFFSSQFEPNEQNMSQKKKVDTYSVTTDVHVLSNSSISDQATGIRNETGKPILDSSVATLGGTSEMEQIEMTNFPIRFMEEDTGNELESGGALIDNDMSMTEADAAIQSVLQPDVSDPSTIIAPSGAHLNCSDKVPLVPRSQLETVFTKAGQLDDNYFDAVVPQLNTEDFNDSSYDLIDFEREE
jgi:hypothetical protein